MPGKRYRQRIFPKPDNGRTSYLGSMNIEIIDNKAVPAFDHGRISGELDFKHYVGAGIEYKAPNGNPRHYIFVNKSAYRYEDGLLTLDGSFTDVVQGAVLCDNGATPGVPIIVAFFGSSTTVNGHYWRDLTTDAAPWTIGSGATKTQAWSAVAVGSDLYLQTGKTSAGRTGASAIDVVEHLVAKVPPGVSPLTATNVGAGEPVGISADWTIVGMVPLRDSVVVARGDGFYVRNDVSKQWDPIRPLMKLLAHGINGKGMAAGENGVWLPCNDGQVFFYDGFNAHLETPYHREATAKDAMRGRISAIADRGDRVVMHEECYFSVIPGPVAAALGVRFFTVIGGVEAEITSGVTDGSNVTPVVANFNGWGGSANDRLYVISPFPIEGITPLVSRNPNGNNNRFTAPAVSNGAGGFTSLGNIVDFTQLSVADRSLVLTGFPPAAAEPVLRWDAINAFDLATADAITLAAQAMSGVYIYRFSPLNTTAMSATTTVDEIGVIEARQGLPVADGDATKDYTHLDRAGCLSRIHVGERVGAAGFRWCTTYVLDTHGGVQGLAWTTAKGGALTNGGYQLLVLGRERQFQIAEGARRDPTRQPYARTTQWTTTEAGPLLAVRNVIFEEGPGQTADPARPKVVKELLAHVNYLQPTDVLRGFLELDNGRSAFEMKADSGSPVRLVNERAGGARKLDVYLAIEDSVQTDPRVPEIIEVWLEWEYGEGELLKDPPFETKAVA